MTDVTEDRGQAGAELSAADEQLLRELTERARTGGLKLTGEGGLLGRLTKMVVEGALEGELDDHLGYAKHDPEGRDGGNSRNGYRAKTVLTDTGPVEISVPRDRDSSFEPKIVAKRQRRLTGVDDMVISLSAKGLTHGEIAAHLAEVYGAEVSKQTITTITDRVMEGMAEWQSRPLDSVYAVIFIDAINVKIREGQVANRPIYLALGVTVDGERDVLGLWAGEHGDGEGAKYWLRVLSEIKNRGVRDVCMLVCDGLKGLPDAVSTVWEKTIVQTCIVHLLRNSFKYASKRDWAQIAKDLKPVYTAASESEALDRFAFISGKRKQNTIKTTTISDGQGRTLWCGAVRPGRMHDQTAMRTEGIAEQFRLYPRVKAEADEGYRGLASEFPGQVSAPPRKPENLGEGAITEQYG